MGFITQQNINNPSINYGNLIDPLNTKPSGFSEKSTPYKFNPEDRYENQHRSIEGDKSVLNPDTKFDPFNPNRLEMKYNDKVIEGNLKYVRKVGLDKLESKYSINIINKYQPSSDKIESPFELIKEGKFDELRKLSSKYTNINNDISKPGKHNNVSTQDINIVQKSIDKYLRGDFVIPVEVNKDVTITRNNYTSPFEQVKKIEHSIEDIQNIIKTGDVYIGDTLKDNVQDRIIKYTLEDVLDSKLGSSEYYNEQDVYTISGETNLQEKEIVNDFNVREINSIKSTLRELIEKSFKYDTQSSDIIKQLNLLDYSNDVLDLPLSGDNLIKIEKSLDEIINTSEITGRFTESNIVNILAKDINEVITKELNSLYDFIKPNSITYFGRKFEQFITNNNPITQFDDSSVLDINDYPQSSTFFKKPFTPFILPFQSEYDDIVSILDKKLDNETVDYLGNKFGKGFTYRQFVTSFNLDEISLFGIGKDVSTVDYFSNVNSSGFVPNTPSLTSYFNFDSSDLDIKSTNGFDSVNYFRDFYNTGFTTNPLLLHTEYFNETSKFGFVTPPNVDYFNNNYNTGFTLYPLPLVTEFINESSLLDFNGSLPNGVNYFTNNWNTGFTIQPIPLVTEFKVDSSILDLGSFGFNVDYFRNTYNTGFTLNAIPLISEFKYESSLLDLGSFGLSVDYFKNTNAKGFTLNPVFLNSDYVFNSSVFDFDGDLPDSGVNYLDISRTYTKNGFGLLMDSSDYINESSLYDFDGAIPNGVDYFGNEHNKGFTVNVTSLITEFLNNTSKFGFDNPSGVDFFRQLTTGFTINQTTSEYNDNSKYDDIDKNRDNDKDKYGSKESEYSTEDRAIRFQTNPNLRFYGLNYNLVNYINNIIGSNLTEIPITLSQDQFELKSQVKQSSYKVNGVILNPSLIKTVNGDEFHPLSLGMSEDEWEDKDGLKGQYWKIDKKNTRQRIDEIYDKFNLRDSSYGGNQPFIIRGIQNPQEVSQNIDWMDNIVGKNPLITGGDDIIRGGIVTHNVRTLYDAKRIGSFLLTPTGIRFMINQQTLQTINPSVETMPSKGADTGIGILDDIIDVAQEIFIGDRPTQRFNPLSIIAQVKSGMDGAKTIRHGVGDPYSSQGTYGEVTKERNKLTNSLFSPTKGLQLSDIDASKTLGDQGKHNRLLMLAKELFPDLLSQSSFPKPPQLPENFGDNSGGGFFDSVLKVGVDALVALGRGILNSINLPFQLGGFAEMLFGGYEGQAINKLSQVNGGPHSRMGIGATIIHRQANSFNFNPDNINQMNFSDVQYASFLNNTKYWRAQLSKNNDTSPIKSKDDFDSTHKKAGFEALIKNSTLLPEVNYLQYEDPLYSQTLSTGKLFNVFRRYAGFDVAPNLTLIDTSVDIRNSIQRDRHVWDGTNGQIGPTPSSPVINVNELNRIKSLFKNYLDDETKYNNVKHNIPEQDRGTFVSPASKTGLGAYLSVAYPEYNKIQDKLNQQRGHGYVHDFRQNIKDGESFDVPNVEDRINNSIVSQPQWKLLMTDPEIADLDNLNRDTKFGEGIQGRTHGFNGGLIDRSNPIDLNLPDASKLTIAQVNSKWDDIKKKSRGDQINLINVIRDASNISNDIDLYNNSTRDNNKDFVRFYFSSIDYWPGSKKGDVLVFRALFDGGISDSFSGNWSEQSIMGRGDQAGMYNGFSRSVSFSFSMFPSSREEMWSNWRKLNALVSWTAPDFGKTGHSKMKGPVIRLTIGDLYVGVPCYMTSCQVNFDESGGWETGNLKDDLKQGTLQLPKFIKVNVSLTIIGNYRPQRFGYMYELNSRGREKDISWINKEEMDYS